jgi:hypothetical protein
MLLPAYATASEAFREGADFSPRQLDAVGMGASRARKEWSWTALPGVCHCKRRGTPRPHANLAVEALDANDIAAAPAPPLHLTMHETC